MVVDGEILWVTLIGRSELVKVVGGDVELFTTGGSPHDLVVARDGKTWFLNWGSDRLSIFDPGSGIVPDAPAGVAIVERSGRLAADDHAPSHYVTRRKAASTGRVSTKVEPPPGVGSYRISAPSVPASPATIDNPRPVPPP